MAVAEADGGELRFFGEIVNTPEALGKLVKQLTKAGAQLSFCCEAGPRGYGIHRQLRALGWAWQVVAPSLIPGCAIALRFSGKCNWTQTHYRWMGEVKFEQPTQYLVMQEYVECVLALSKRFKAFEEHIQKAASESVFWPVMKL